MYLLVAYVFSPIASKTKFHCETPAVWHWSLVFGAILEATRHFQYQSYVIQF